MLLGKISKIKSEIKSPSIPLLPESEWIAKTRSPNRDGELEREKGCSLYTHLWTTCYSVRKGLSIAGEKVYTLSATGRSNV